MSETARFHEPVHHATVWAESLAQVLGQISGSAVPCAALSEAPAELAPAGEPDLWLVATASGGLRGEMSLRLPAATMLRLAQVFMSEPPAPAAEPTAEHREAAVELVRQVGGLVATQLKQSWGEVHLQLDAAGGAPSWPAAADFWLRVGDDSLPSTLVELHFSAALVAALNADRTSQQTPASSDREISHGPDNGAGKLDLLMDVDLAVTLRFGSRRLLLREVLDLAPGAVIELDRQVGDPVDALLDGRLVARGEVVVLDGNYALRITEVAPASAS